MEQPGDGMHAQCLEDEEQMATDRSEPTVQVCFESCNTGAKPVIGELTFTAFAAAGEIGASS